MGSISEIIEEGKKMNRRSFLKRTLAAAGVIAMPGSLKAKPETVYEKTTVESKWKREPKLIYESTPISPDESNFGAIWVAEKGETFVRKGDKWVSTTWPEINKNIVPRET